MIELMLAMDVTHTFRFIDVACHILCGPLLKTLGSSKPSNKSSANSLHMALARIHITQRAALPITNHQQQATPFDRNQRPMQKGDSKGLCAARSSSYCSTTCT